MSARGKKRNAAGALRRAAAHRGFDANLAYEGRTLHAEGMLVSGAYFPLLGIQPALGRLLGPADDETIGGHPVAVLSYGFWERQLGADPGVLDETIVVNGRSLTVVGVAPRGFEGTTLGIEPRVFVPITMSEAILPELRGGLGDRLHYWIYLFGRLKPGVSIQRADMALNSVYSAVINDVEVPLQPAMDGQTMARFRAKKIALTPGARGQSTLHVETRRPLILLFSVTGIVLLIACANIANLLLARGANRGMEMAVRLSLGAGRGRIVRQLLIESCVLAVLGGAASLLVAGWMLSAIGSILPPEAVAGVHFELSWPVVIFTAALTLGTGVIFGLFPALHSTRPDLVTTIRANAGQIAGTRTAARFRGGLVIAQVALSMVLLISAGLFIESLRNIGSIDLGVRAMDRVVTFAISPGLNGYEPARTRTLFERVETELAAIPGVKSVSGAVVPILAGVSSGSAVTVEGSEQGAVREGEVRENEVGADYFETVGVPLIAGRELGIGDAKGAPRVAIVNETFAKKFGLGRDVVGKRMGIGTNGPLDIEIVGLVKDARYFDAKGDVPALFVTPYRQDEGLGALTFYVRTAGDPERLVQMVPTVIAKLDPNLPVERLKTLPQQLRESVFLDRVISALSAAFAVLATLLAAIGLYGVMAYAVTQRTREIGVRIALGADRGRIRGMVLRQVGRMVAIGVAIGIAAALALGRAVESMLFGLGGNDPAVALIAVATITVVALGAGYLPARRASGVDPVRALNDG
jgi:predicted permease